MKELQRITLKLAVTAILLNFVAVLAVFPCMAQSRGDDLRLKVSFPQGSAVLDPSFDGNASRLSAFQQSLDSLTRNKQYTVRKIYIRATTSPEGRYQRNQDIAGRRAVSLQTYLQALKGLETTKYILEGQGIAWDQLSNFIRSDTGFRWRDDFLRIIDEVSEIELRPDGSVYERRKAALSSIDGGRPYRQIYDAYFHGLRGAQADVTCVLAPAPIPVPALSSYAYARAHTSDAGLLYNANVPAKKADRTRNDGRLPLIAVKTNLLFDFAVAYPGYGWAPVPNVALEYYPLRGHWTAGVSLDCPWWSKPDHKYFQIRNYQIEARRYFRPENGFYTGWFLSAYAHAGLFSIGLNDHVGGQGEGAGAGLGAGYVLPLSRNGHWKIEFTAQAGYSYAWYDRFVYGDPVTGELDGLYYYNWMGHADDFVKRLYRRSWIGPTRVGVNVSYDIFKRRKKEAGR